MIELHIGKNRITDKAGLKRNPAAFCVKSRRILGGEVKRQAEITSNHKTLNQLLQQKTRAVRMKTPVHLILFICNKKE